MPALTRASPPRLGEAWFRIGGNFACLQVPAHRTDCIGMQTYPCGSFEGGLSNGSHRQLGYLPSSVMPHTVDRMRARIPKLIHNVGRVLSRYCFDLQNRSSAPRVAIETKQRPRLIQCAWGQKRMATRRTLARPYRCQFGSRRDVAY
jgi:hypothetical protein